MTRRVALRASALALAAIAVLVGLTIYFSSEAAPPCLISGVQKWQKPSGATLRRFEVVALNHALCFFDMDDSQQLIGYMPLPNITQIAAAVPRNGKLAVRYGHGRGALVDLQTERITYGVNPPSVSASPGRSRAPDRPELWVLDAPRDTIRIFDVRSTAPKAIATVRLTRHVRGVGRLQHSNDGRFVYVGGVGDVIDTGRREEIANLQALRASHVMFEVDWSGGKPLLASGG